METNDRKVFSAFHTTPAVREALEAEAKKSTNGFISPFLHDLVKTALQERGYKFDKPEAA